MASNDETKNKVVGKKKKHAALEVLESIMWFAFAGHQGFMGWVLLTNFDDYFVLGSGLLAVLLALVVVGVHFIAAHRDKI